MPLDTIVRFHAREGQEEVVARAMHESAAAVRAELGCRGIEYFRSTRDPRLFFIHSRWADEAAFLVHAELPHTHRFLEQVELVIDHALEVVRLRPLE